MALKPFAQAFCNSSFEGCCVVSPDLALALLINRTTQAYASHAPSYIVYQEYTHVEALGRSREIDRAVAVRDVDNAAVMQDLPSGATRTGEAFPINPYFDPFSSYSFDYYANLKMISITLDRGEPWRLAIPPSNPDVDVVVPYFTTVNVVYAPDSRPDRLHFFITPTPSNGDHIYWSEVVEDPQSGLPSRVVLRDPTSDMTVTLDYSIVGGYWIITHGNFAQTERVLGMTFVANADVTFSHFSFPASPPPALASLPSPSPSPTP